MTWYVITDEGGTEGKSSALYSKDHALGFAKAVIEFGIPVLRIESIYGDEVTAGEVLAWCESRQPRGKALSANPASTRHSRSVKADE